MSIYPVWAMRLAAGTDQLSIPRGYEIMLGKKAVMAPATFALTIGLSFRLFMDSRLVGYFAQIRLLSKPEGRRIT